MSSIKIYTLGSDTPHIIKGRTWIRECDNQGREVYKGKIIHREKGPAIIYSGNRCLAWYNNGLRHRDDGPAFIGATVNWFIRGTDITKRVQQWIRETNLPNYTDWTNSDKVLFKLKFA